MPIPNIQPEALEISVIINTKHNKPYVELRTGTTNEEIIKAIVSAAFHKRPIIVQPTFTNQLRSVRSMIDKGILYRKEDQYFFTF